MSNIKLENMRKVYDDAKGTDVAVSGFSLSIDDGEFVVLVGPSGCGKSTTLQMIAGLETVTNGQIYIDNREVQMLDASARDVAMVFQKYALYPTMSARENIEYGLKHSTDLSPSERHKKVEDIAEMMGIRDLLENAPSELSGGQKQRVALGRALVREPSVFLLDEPLSNLDAKLRADMRRELQRIHSEIGVTSVYVTHDQTEAMTMADRIVVMNDGRIQQVGDAEDLYNSPNNRFVATFIGSPSMNIIQATVNKINDEYVFKQNKKELCTISKSLVSTKVGDTVQIGLRPEDITLFSTVTDGTFEAEVQVVEYQGDENYIHFQLNNETLVARTDPNFSPDIGHNIGVSVAQEDIYLFGTNSNKAIKTKIQSKFHSAE